jgi:hypothetical protein
VTFCQRGVQRRSSSTHGTTPEPSEEFDQVVYFTRLKQWKEDGKSHVFLEFVVPEEKLKLLKWKGE